MGRRRGSNRKKPRTGRGRASDGDRITDLPLELRARIASFLHYREVVQLSTLSRPWRHIHHHTPVVKISLFDFLHLPDVIFDEENSVPGLLDQRSILDARLALGRRAEDGSASKVDTLRLYFFADDPRMLRHAGRIIELAHAREIHIQAPLHRDQAVRQAAWALNLPPAAHLLDVRAFDTPMPAIAGPGAAALQVLSLDRPVIREWPQLPSLRSLDIVSGTIVAPFGPGSCFHLLEELELVCCKIQQARVDIRLEHLVFVLMDSVDVGECEGPPFGQITIDAPELVSLNMLFEPGCTREFKSFTLRAPKLRSLCWYNQFAERVDIDVGRPSGVEFFGTIEFMSVYLRKIKDFQDLMMRMLQALLPDVPPENVADIARPYLTREECPDSDSDYDTVEEKLICNLSALMSRRVAPD